MRRLRYKVFVYGTLMKDFYGYKKYLKSAKFIGNAKIKGKLYQTQSNYPVAILTNDEKFIDGEIYEVDRDTMIKLRNYEGVYSFFTYYKEATVSAILDTGEKVYVRSFVAHPLALLFIYFSGKFIKSGSWKDFIENPPVSYKKWALTLILILFNLILLIELVVEA